MNTIKAEVGMLCQSVSGRDVGGYFIIKELLQDNYVTMCDGNYRKVDRPKKKKIKHIKLYPVVFENIKDKFIQGKQVFDSEVFSALKQYNVLSAEEE